MARARFQPLRLDDRRSIHRLSSAGATADEIAARLGRHRSSIYRELRRNDFRDRDAAGDRWRDFSGDHPVTAQQLAQDRRQRLAKLARDDELRAHVVDCLRAGWSPQQIAGRLRLDRAAGNATGGLCHETIYRHVYGQAGRSDDLCQCLPRARKRRRTRHGRRPRGHRILTDRRIGCRPAEASTRASVGHWEADLMIFARSGSGANVTTLLERASRFLILLPNPDRRPSGVASRIGSALEPLSAALRQTVAFDRGIEFMAYPALDQRLTLKSYFCDPRSPWQKGAVENANGRLRRYLPPDVAEGQLSAECLKTLAERLNATPRRGVALATERQLRCLLPIRHTRPAPLQRCRIWSRNSGVRGRPRRRAA